ncbi:purine-nucleoside phosphorylase [Frisingicoccus sp.]|uniref:purine-nucleoside phosphorylase n=1 Tax=Frisingicoccus sp. TaxID=1918627 RepID=UPI002EBEE32A|nr:purine-nucleoside phosphorylase [Frisingicoccus sp.]
MSTPHNKAEYGDIAKTVLMPGDPLRAKFIADNFLENVRLVSDVRNIYTFTGLYEGNEISVMASGMGMGSMGIYSYELFKEYGVENIIRIGSAGAYSERLKLYDVVLAESVWSESTYAKVQNGCMDDILYPDPSLNQKIMDVGAELGVEVIPVRVHSTDVFYTEPNVDDYKAIYAKHQCECVDMESFALFHNAKVLGKKASCLLTISDSFVTHEQTTSEERETAFTKMMKVALMAAK